MLTEAQAWTLLKRHCDALQDLESVQWAGVDFDRHSEWPNPVCEQVDLIALPMDASSGIKPRITGARVNLALRVVHAVSCCRGFEPATHQRFWRRVVAKLWPGYQFGRGESFAFANTTFAHVGVEWHAYSRADDAFWIGFFHGTAESNSHLTAALETLKPHMPSGSPPPPLRISLSRCSSSKTRRVKYVGLPESHTVDDETAVEPLVVKTILRAALDPQSPQLSNAWSIPTHFGLVLEFRVDEDALARREMLDLLARARTLTRPQFTIDRLSIQLTPTKLPRHAAPGIENHRTLVTRGRALGELLRTLVVHNATAAPRVNAVVLFGCSLTDYRLVGAALSAVAWASPPITELRCSRLGNGEQLHHQLLRLAWLVYALHTRHLRFAATPTPPLRLALLSCAVVVSEQESAYVQQLLATRTPLRDVVGDALRMRYGDARLAHLRVECLRLGSTVTLSRGTPLYYEPENVADEFVVVTLWATDDNDEVELDAVAHVVDHGVVGVVYAGYGLLWADVARVVAWQRSDDDVRMMMDVEDDDDHDSSAGHGDETRVAVSVSSLAFSFEGIFGGLSPTLQSVAHRIVFALPLLMCDNLETLTIDRGVLLRDDLAALLDTCPRLQTLVLDRCVVESVAPLLDAYTRPPWQLRRARVAALSLLGARDLRVRDTLVGSGTPLMSNLMSDTPEVSGAAAEWVGPLVDTLASGVACGVLCELRIDCKFMPSLADERKVLERLALAVTSASLSLTRLHVSCHDYVQDACEAWLGPLRDVVLPDPPHVRRAVLSVMRAFRCVVPDIARTLLALVEGNVVRTVTWDSQSNP